MFTFMAGYVLRLEFEGLQTGGLTQSLPSPTTLGKGSHPNLGFLWELIPDSTWVWHFHCLAPGVSLPWARPVICSDCELPEDGGCALLPSVNRHKARGHY